MVRARAEAAGLRVFGAAGARVQAVRRHASHAVELGQEVRSHALRLGGQVARRLPNDAAEGAAGYSQHWREETRWGSSQRPFWSNLGSLCKTVAPLKSKSRIGFMCRVNVTVQSEAASFQAEKPDLRNAKVLRLQRALHALQRNSLGDALIKQRLELARPSGGVSPLNCVIKQRRQTDTQRHPRE